MIDVFTPTIRHDGIKLVAKCLERQDFQDFRWVIVDHDYDLTWFYLNIPISLWDKTLYLKPKVQIPERKYKLWNTRNTGYQFLENPLVVEIQDYHWFGPETLRRFWVLYNQIPRSLVSAYYKIVTFKNIEKAHEGTIEDSDVEVIDETARGKMAGKIARGRYSAYEMNVSSIPLEFIRNHPVDENMDNGYLVDTHYFSIPAEAEGYDILVDGEMRVYSFEHKLYEKRPDGWRGDCEVNQGFLREKYSKELAKIGRV